MMNLTCPKWRISLSLWLSVTLVVGQLGAMTVGSQPALADETAPTPPPPPQGFGASGITPATTSGDKSNTSNKTPIDGLDFKLSEGKAQVETATGNPVVTGEPLSEEETNKLLKLLPPLEEETLPVFQLPAHSLPPPNSQHKISEPFPPAEEKAAPARIKPLPLTVISKRPVGQIDTGSNISITFSQPMVPVSSQEAVAALTPPVKLAPKVPGEWKWYGTQTLTFEPTTKSMPMSTTFKLTIPAGTKSATKSILASDLSWSFSTATTRLIAHYPDGGQTVRPTTLMMARFNQKVDVNAILSVTKIVSAGRTYLAVPASEKEIDADATLTKRLKSIPSGMYVVFKSAEPLPNKSLVNVSIGPGIKSAEGPNVATTAGSFSFRTFGPLNLLPPAQKEWQPEEALQLRFTNNLDGKTVKLQTVSVTPPIPDMQVQNWGNSIALMGNKKAKTTYHVQVNPSLRDQFGQSASGNLSQDFNTTHVEKQLYMPTRASVLATKSKPRFSLTTVNLDALNYKIYRVEPSQYFEYLSDADSFLKHVKVAAAEKLQIKGNSDEVVNTEIDLNRWLKDGRGSLVISVSTRNLPNSYEKERRCWLQCTNLGLDIIAANRSMLAWATDLETGAPIKGASVAVRGLSGEKAITDENGLVAIPLSQFKNDSPPAIIAYHGKDVALVGEPYGWSPTASPENTLRWYVLTDRSPYRPGETVNVKGTIRKRIERPNTELSLPNQLKSLTYTFRDSTGNVIGTGQTDVNKFGGFDLSFKLPENVNLGQVQLTLNAQNMGSCGDLENTTAITVAEFRRPEFELKLKNEGQPVQVIGDSTTISASTNYYAGGSLTHTDIHWFASSQSTNYSPPGWSEFIFGKRNFPFFDFMFWQAPRVTGPPQELNGKTDANGKHYLKVDFLGVRPPEPSTLTINATVQDVNRQTWSASTSVLVHPSTLYVGTKLEKSFVKKGDKLPLSIIVTDIDGKIKPGTSVTIEAWRSENRYTENDDSDNGSKPTEVKDDVQELAVTSGDKPVQLSVQANLTGLYKFSATITDSAGHKNETTGQFWVEGGEVRAKANPDAAFAVQKLLLIPEKTELKPGDEANILIQSPFAPAEGNATIFHNGILSHIPFHMDETTYRLKIPVSEQHMPAFNVSVDLVGMDKKSSIRRAAPAEATNSLDFTVSLDSKKLNVEVKPDPDKSEPGKEATINLTVTDHAGRAVQNAEVTVAVVDDALLSLTGYSFADPFDPFFTVENGPLAVLREREMLDMTPYILKNASNLKSSNRNGHMPPVPPMAVTPAPIPVAMGGGGSAAAAPEAAQFQLAGAAPRLTGATNGTMAPQMMRMKSAGKADDGFADGVSSGAADAFSVAAPVSVQLRSNFDALAKWAPSTMTDENGHAIVKFKLPDNLTRYRVMSVVSSGSDEFGRGESSLTVRLPLMAKPSAPRFLNYGDKFELPVVIQNQTDSPMNVSLAARATNAVFTNGQGRRTTVPPNDRVEIRLPAATAHSGQAKFQVMVASGATTDAAQFNLPVYTPATTEAFATYGQIDKGGIEQIVQTPTDVIPDFGALELTTSTTILETLTDAFLYLHRYKFECSEQLSSKLIGIAVLKDMLKAFHATEMPTDAEIKATVKDSLQKLQSRQQSNGSFALWSSNERVTYPYVTLNVVHSLVLTRAAGYDVPKDMLERALQYVRNINNYIQDYKGDSRLLIQSFALYIRDLNGENVTSAAATLLKGRALNATPLETLGLMAKIFAHHPGEAKSQAAEVMAYLSNLVVETAGTAQLVQPGSNELSDFRLFDSPMRLNAILFDAFIANGAPPDLVTKLMKSILGGRIKGRWDNTQENTYVLIAMRHYFDKFEKTEPNLIAQAWLGNEFIGESTFKGRTADYKAISVPMSYLAERPASQEFVLKKTGDGRLYYRLGMSYAPKNLQLQALDRGFTVSRTYEGAKNAADVSHDKDGVWHFKAGSLVKVKLKVSAPAARFFVALVDPLPGGAEALNEDLQGTEKIPPKTESSSAGTEGEGLWWCWWNRFWWNHENKRDNQAEVFADQLQGGSHEYSYLLRATTPGTFVVPPTKAEEMYSPETFGRARTESVVID